MVSERQIVALLALTGTIVTLGFAVYQVYVAFKPVEAAKA